MPGFLTHYICGDLVLKSIDSGDIKDITSKYRNLFNLGTQGPDMFYYHNAYPWCRGERLGQMGDGLHFNKVNAFFKNALETIDKAQQTAKGMILSYIYGYICHYSLDIHTHPYIIYKSGFPIDEAEDKKKYDALHRRMETEIDKIMAKEILSESTNQIDGSKFIEIDREESFAIAGMYHYAFQNIFNIYIPIKSIQKTTKDMAAVTKALRDPLGLKKPAVAFLEKCMHKHHLVSNMIYPLRIDEGLEHLNLSHSPWYYPWDESLPQNSSFIDLFNEAIEEAKIMCKSINDYINMKTDMNEVLEVLGNRSFSSGLDCDKDMKFKCCNSIYK